jgi:[pyruvate, water dikinase]-phosphate phosphotransferase / [pyruvate, water dikinase] kinase
VVAVVCFGPDFSPGPECGGGVPVFFLSDNTGISAETMGNALLIQFPTSASSAP